MAKNGGACYLFLGPEIGKKQDAIADIRRDLERRFNAPPEETSFYAGETPVTVMAAVIRNGSLFAEGRLFFIKNAEAVQKKEDVELLASCMAAPRDGAVLILISEAVSLNRNLEKAVPREAKRIFWELFENEKAEWVSSFFRRGGYRISAGGVEAVLEMVENNTEALRRECSRLMFFAAAGRTAAETIEAEDVERWLSHTREESAFTLFSRIAAGDLEKSLETMRILLGAKEAPQAILAGLTWCFRKLRDYLSLGPAQRANDFELKKIGLSSVKVRRDYTAAAERYDSPGTDRCLSVIAEYDIRLRAGGVPLEGLLLDLFLCAIHGIALGRAAR
ncbi:MAG: DNA polymerase III subunit delta [Treponema sp.]|jgi:DNA polymerase-3 subunit delta|nr:DNA polymerase III subunit delta [Treponema sp.]